MIKLIQLEFSKDLLRGIPFVFVVLIFPIQAWADTNPAQPEPPILNNITIKYSGGDYWLLPSLINNSNLQYDSDKRYSDIFFDWDIRINSTIQYVGKLELTDLPHQIIGTKFSRADFILSTGRFQESYFTYEGKSFSAIFGRANFFSGTNRSGIFVNPINGDGLSWKYELKRFEFKHVLESLPAEKSGVLVFRRLLTYHHLVYHIKDVAIGAGEYFILTGTPVGLDFKRLNPFLPFSLNSHDSEADLYPGYTGDSDNALIKLFLIWNSNTTTIDFNLYIDEFQMDSWDREIYSDALLLNIVGQREYDSFLGNEFPWILEGTVSLANPNFGEHPGPFTTTTSASYPLFEYSPGMLSLIYVKSELQPGKNSTLSISYHHERWVYISSLSPALRNKKAALQSLAVQQDSRVVLSYRQELGVLHTSIMVKGWWTSVANETYGTTASLIHQFTF